MSINQIGSKTTVDAVKAARAGGAATFARPVEEVKKPRADTVQISPEAKALAAQRQDTAQKAPAKEQIPSNPSEEATETPVDKAQEARLGKA